MQIPKIFVSPFQVATSVKGNTESLFSALNVRYKGSIPIYCVPICSLNRNLLNERRPASLSVIDGTLYLSRLDVLLENRLWIVLWGSTNLTNKKTTLFLGITGRTLTDTLGITQISPTFVLPIRIEKDLDNLSVSRQDIVAAIAFLSSKIYAQMVNPAINLDFLFERNVPPMSCPPPWL